MGAAQQVEFCAHQHDVAEDAFNLLLHGGHEMGNRAVIRTIAAAERHEEDVLATGSLDLSRTDHPSGISEQDHFEQDLGVDRCCASVVVLISPLEHR